MKIDLPPYSVLMAVYKKDNPEYLEIAIKSMLEQTISPDELVLVEDGPLTKELDRSIADLQKQNEHIRIIALPQNRGLGHALNCGLKECSHELVARMDADDISLSERCEKQLCRFAANPDLVILGTQLDEFIGSSDNIISSRKVPVFKDDIGKFARKRSPFNHPTVMYKKSIILKYGGYKPLRRKEDLDLFLRIVFDGCYVENLPDSLLLYRTDENNLKRRKSWVNCKENIAVMYDFYKKGQIGITDMLYVVVGQMTMFLTPEPIAEMLSARFLRQEK